MDYKKHYDLLIKKALERLNLDGYTETHHIIPKSMDGSNDQNNLVVLTAREHFIAHFLLAKIYGGNQWQAVHAFVMHKNGRRYTNSRLFERARKEKAKLMSGDNSWARKNADKLLRGKNHPRIKYREKWKDFKIFEGLNSPENIKKRSGENSWQKKYPEKILRGNDHWTRKKPELLHRGEAHYMKRPEHRLRISGGNNPSARRIRCVETNKIFDTATLACEWVQSISGKYPDLSSIIKACKGKYKSCAGYHWEYADIAPSVNKD